MVDGQTACDIRRERVSERITSPAVSAPATRRLTTGTVKIRCHFGKWAMITQHSGMVIAPTTNAHDATLKRTDSAPAGS